MLGPLPPLYRWVVYVLALLTCVGLGAWAAWSLPGPLLAPAGAGIGAAVGVAVVALLRNDRAPRLRRVRSRHIR